MKSMEPMDSTSPNNFIMFLATFLLALLGELGAFIRENHDTIGMFFQWFAWGGAGTVGLVSFIKMLQDNGFLPKGRAKK